MMFIEIITFSSVNADNSTTPLFESRNITINITGTTKDSVEINEVDKSWPNNEVIFNGWGHNISYEYGEGEIWYWDVIWNRSYDVWYTPALAVGDLDPDVEGVEVVDGLYQLFVISYNNTTQSWNATMIWDPWTQDQGTVRTVKIGDFDPRHSGNELFCCTYGGLIREFYKAENGTWMMEVIDDTHTGKAYEECDIGDFDPRFEGNECVVFTEENLTMYAWNGSGWYWEEIHVKSYAKHMMCGRVGEVLPGNNESEIICGDTDGMLWIIWWNNTSYANKEIWINTSSFILAVAIGDCWSGHEGNEIVAGAYEECYLVWEENGTWKKELIFKAPQWEYITDLEIGEFDTLHPGNEIAVACGELFELYEEIPVRESSGYWLGYIVLLICPVVVVWKWRENKGATITQKGIERKKPYLALLASVRGNYEGRISLCGQNTIRGSVSSHQRNPRLQSVFQPGQ
ncbi:MAG: hypothetical protein QXU48_00440 [Thermoplasmata archaeon]